MSKAASRPHACNVLSVDGEVRRLHHFTVGKTGVAASGGGFETLTRYMILGFLPIYGLVAFAAILARRRGRPAVFAMPLYPWPVILMLVYVVAGLASGFAGDAAGAGFIGASAGAGFTGAAAAMTPKIRSSSGVA